jgi:hypothetical protein
MNVHEDNIGKESGDLLESFFGGATSADAAMAGRVVEVPREGGAEVGIVFNDGDRSHRKRLWRKAKVFRSSDFQIIGLRGGEWLKVASCKRRGAQK